MVSRTIFRSVSSGRISGAPTSGSIFVFNTRRVFGRSGRVRGSGGGVTGGGRRVPERGGLLRWVTEVGY